MANWPKKKKKPKHHNERWAREDKLRPLIRKRGRECFYCGRTMALMEMTVEHLVPLSKGGRNKKSNLFLAHGECNQQAGNMNYWQKMELRRQLHRKYKVALS